MVVELQAPANNVLKSAVASLSDRSKFYRIFNEYYDGIQPLTYSSSRYRNAFASMVSNYVENMCIAVVDTIADRLIIRGFEVEGSDNNSIGEQLWQLWNNNDMDIAAGEIHSEAVKTGDAYLIVWPNNDNEPVFYAQRSVNCTVHYDDETGQIDYGCKWWKSEDNYGYLNIYYAARIEKYKTRAVMRSNDLNNKELALIETVPNPFNKVPMFHFPNNAGVGMFGRSELADVIPVQNALNKSVADLLVGQEFSAFAQRWVTGMEMETDALGNVKPTFVPGPDRLWATEGKDVQFGEFASTDLTRFIAVHDMFLLNIARISGVPTHHMLINPSVWPSGESLKTAEARFTSKIEDRQLTFGRVWKNAMTFAAEIGGFSLTGRVKPHWKDAAPRSDVDFFTSAINKAAVGISNEQIQREYGYSESEIEQMQKEKDADAERSLQRNMNALAAQTALNPATE